MRRPPAPRIPPAAARAVPLAALLVALLAALAACGGGGEEEPGPPVTLVLPVFEDATVSNQGTVLAAGSLEVGDEADNTSRRVFLRFDLSALPAGRYVEEARLQVTQTAVDGYPYASLGALRVDRMDLDAGIDAGDFYAVPRNADVATLSLTPVLETKNADVTAALRADVAAGLPYAEFRLRFQAETDFQSDRSRTTWLSSEGAAPGTGAPVLSVTYR